MPFKFSLLAGLLLVLSVDAAPRPRTSYGLVTLPLKRLEQRSDTTHPLIAHQQNINRSYRRYARMTGRTQPTTDELTENLRKRMVSIEEIHMPAKRFSRIGIPTTLNTKTASSGATFAVADAKNKTGKGHHGKAKATGAALGGAAGAAGASDADDGDNTNGGNSTMSGNSTIGGSSSVCSNSTIGGSSTTGSNTTMNSNSTASSNSNIGGNSTTSTNNPAAGAGIVAPANPPTANNSLGLSIESNDVGYLATVQMGTPPQNFVLLMDSGSADTWVGGENCASQQGGGCGNHKFLGTTSSSSFKNSAQQFQVTYGTGQVAGTVVQDNLVIAGLTLNAHTFGAAATESVDFTSNSVPFDGLMGLAQSSLSQQKTLTPIEALAKAGLVASAITSFKISRLADNKNDGEVTFGGLDPTKFDAQTLVSLPNVSKKGFWEAAVDAVSVGGTDLGLTGRTAILDTGTTLIIAPQADADAVHQAIPGAKSDGQGGFTVPCSTNASVAMTFGGRLFAIDTRDLAVQPLNANNPNGDCVSGIAAGNIGGANEWLVGDVFLKNAYFSTDVAKNTVSLAKLI